MLSQPDPDDDGAPARRLRQDEGDAEVIGQRIGDVGGDLGDVGLDPFGVLEVVVVGEFDQHAGARVLATSPSRVVGTVLTSQG